VVDGDCRRALVRRFPYAIFFESGQRTVTVYAVLQISRILKDGETVPVRWPLSKKMA